MRALCEAQITDELLWPQLAAIMILPQPMGFRVTMDVLVRLAKNRVTLGHPISRITLPLRLWRIPKEVERLKELVEVK